jgi:lipopolysaccharide biosynthesis protein
VNVVEVENRARDIGPFLTKFTSRYYDYDLVCKVHSKKSPHAHSLRVPCSGFDRKPFRP